MRDWVSTPARAALACLSLIALPAAAKAGDLHLQPGIFSDPEFNPTYSFGASISNVNGSAHEYVFQNSGATKLSELDWQINNVTMLSATLGLRFTPWLGFDLSAGTKVNASKSYLQDTDWIWHGPDTWDLQSESPDTLVKGANRVDALATLALYRHPNFTVNALAGVRWNEWEFEATGGTFIYSSDANHLRDKTLSLPDNTPAITYKQDLLTPYLGLGVDANFGRFGLNASATGSDWVFANTYDQHHLRTDISKTGGLFNDTMHDGKYYDIKFGGTYTYSDRVSFNASWEREDYLLVKGQTNIYAVGVGVNGTGGAGGVNFPGPSGGIDNSTDRYSLGVTYKMP